MSYSFMCRYGKGRKSWTRAGRVYKLHATGERGQECWRICKGELFMTNLAKRWREVIADISQFSHSVVSDSLQPHEPQHARPSCPSPTLRVHSNSRPLSQWCHPTISSSVIPFSYCLQSFPASGSFPVSHLFTSGGQSIGVSASTSVFTMNIHVWFPLGLTGWIFLQSKGLSSVFSNISVQKQQFVSAQPYLLSNSHIHTWLLEKP